MPVIITSREKHPFLPSLGDPSAIDYREALRQDVRPLEILIVNLMADKQTTERQLAQWLGHTPLQINLTFAATDSYMAKVREGHQSRNTQPDHINKFYRPFSDVKESFFDGLIVTGVNALQSRVEEEIFWPEVQAIFDWSRTRVFSSLFLCWGAKAALKHFHNIDSHKAETKLFGLFEHDLLSDSTGIAFGLPERFSVPVSRWKSPDRAAIEACWKLEIVASSALAGPNMLVEPEALKDRKGIFPRRVYILNHPEYETNTLKAEYERDVGKKPGIALPHGYFPDNVPQTAPANLWRHTGFIYINWINLLYAATPYEINKIPNCIGGGKRG